MWGMDFTKIRLFLGSVVCTAWMASMVSCSDSLVQRTPDPQTVFSALGIQTWQVDFTLPPDHPSGLAIYSKAANKEPIAINGTTIFNYKDGPLQKKVTATIVLQTIYNPNGKGKFLVGLTLKSKGASTCVSSATREIEYPFAPATLWTLADQKLKMDAKGRVLLAYSEGTNSLADGRSVDDYPAAIYLQLAPFGSK